MAVNLYANSFFYVEGKLACLDVVRCWRALSMAAICIAYTDGQIGLCRRLLAVETLTVFCSTTTDLTIWTTCLRSKNFDRSPSSCHFLLVDQTWMHMQCLIARLVLLTNIRMMYIRPKFWRRRPQGALVSTYPDPAAFHFVSSCYRWRQREPTEVVACASTCVLRADILVEGVSRRCTWEYDLILIITRSIPGQLLLPMTWSPGPSATESLRDPTANTNYKEVAPNAATCCIAYLHCMFAQLWLF
jgi:hypothetical protein